MLGEEPISFGPYQVLARLAAGGMANVLLAREPRTPGTRLLVIKTMLPELSDREEVVGMFLDEIAVSQQLVHPNCVRTYGSGRLKGTHFMTMEFLLGDTVASLVQAVRRQGGLLPARIVAWIAACAADGLHYMHELKSSAGEPLGLIHRDVSPQNLMVTYDGRVKTFDFGICSSKTKRQATNSGIIKGKLRYMSFEHLTGRTIDRRADVYALGVVLFEVLTTKRLIKVESQEAIIKMLTRQPLPSPQDFRPDLPDALVWITSRALALHAEDRYSTAADMADDLRAFVRSEPGGEPEAELAAYVDSLFGPRIRERRALCERVVAGEIDLPSIRSTFDAQRALNIDLHPAANDLELSSPPVRSLYGNATVADASEVSVQIAFESPIDWEPSLVSMGSLLIPIEVAEEEPPAVERRLARAIPELGLLDDHSAVADQRLLELANLWLEPKRMQSVAAAFVPPLGLIDPAPNDDVTRFEQTDPDEWDAASQGSPRRSRRSQLIIGLLMGAVIGGLLGGLVTWLLTRS